jgi:CheY-like chemotaxis protein
VALTILAVDDSATMRKILEITFAGSDFNPVLVSSGQEALDKLQAGGISLVICDNSLEGDGYAVAGQLKAAAPGVPLLFLSSRQNPYDAGKGSAARVDDHIDKPFDTTQMLDRVGKLASGGVGAAAAAPAAAPAPAPAPAPAAAAGGFGSGTAKGKTMAYGGAPQPAAPAAAPKAAGFGAGGFGGSKPAPAPSPAPAPVAAKPAAAPAAAPAARPAAAAAVSAATSAANGQLAAKMGELGLTPQQADAVLAISRDLLERVVWEVVPTLAEVLIKEEIQRLTK